VSTQFLLKLYKALNLNWDCYLPRWLATYNNQPTTILLDRRHLCEWYFNGWRPFSHLQ